MRKFCTRFFAFALLLVVMISFTACSLFTDNLDQKYSADIMVASAANNPDVTVSKRELYQVYLQWGYQYAGQMEEEELLTALTEYVLNQKIMKQLSIAKFGPIYESEKTLARKNAYDALDKTLRQYVYEALDRDDPENSTEDTKDDAVTYEPYTKSIYVDNSGAQPVFTLNLDAYKDQNDNLLAADYQTYSPNVPGVATDKVAKQALSKIVRALKNNETGFEKLPKATTYLNEQNYLIKSLTTDERYVLNREITRLIENNETALVAGRMNTAFYLGIDTPAGWQDYLNRSADFDLWQQAINADKDTWASSVYHAANGRSIATGIADNVTAYYQDRVKNAILNYQLNPDADLESTIMGGSLDEIYYIPQNVANNLFTVSHILVGFTDEQKKQYQDIMAEAEKNPAYDVTNKLNELQSATTSNGKNVYEIYNEVKAKLNAASSLTEKYTLFRDLMYQYNTDPGMQNQTYEYLMSVNKDKNKMIAAFTDASLALREKGEKGAISEIVWGEYGAHIIMYTRDVADFIWTADPSMLARDYGKTLFAPLTSYGNKTKFDVLAEIFTRSYNNYEAALLREFKSENEISIVTSAFKNFF